MVTGEQPEPEGAAAPERRAATEALDELLESLRGAVRAVERLRAALDGGAPARPTLVRREPAVAREPGAAPQAMAEPERAPSLEQTAPRPQSTESPASAFERLWERMERERLERKLQEAGAEPERRGLELLPQLYLMTVEDRDRRVDLVPLHRALQSLKDIEEFTLVSFANGVPVVSIRSQRELDFASLERSFARTMGRPCELIPQDTGRIFLRLRPHDDDGGA